MFRRCNEVANFEDSASETWTEDKELNPLCVNRLGYRDITTTILDFVRSGQKLVASREGYLNNEDFEHMSDNYFEDTSTDLDNLQRFQQDLEKTTKSKKKNSDFSTDGGEVSKPDNKDPASKTSPQMVEKPEVSSSDDEN